MPHAKSLCLLVLLGTFAVTVEAAAQAPATKSAAPGAGAAIFGGDDGRFGPFEVEVDGNRVWINGQVVGAAEPGAMDAFARGLASAKMVKAPFMGVSVAEATGALASQLKLDKGVGLVVEQVVPDSPAQAAGLKEHDVLTKLNDQILVDAQQLTVLVRNSKAGDEVKLTLFRQGQLQTVPVKLVEKEVPELGGEAPALWQGVLQGAGAGGAPPALPMPPVQIPLPNGPNGLQAPFGAWVFAGAPAQLDLPAGVDSLQSTYSDGMTLKVTRQGEGGKEIRLLATDNAGKALFDGAVTTPEQRKALPADVAERLHALLQPAMPKMLFRTGGLGGPPTPVVHTPPVAVPVPPGD